jgi:hypothetical protein
LKRYNYKTYSCETSTVTEAENNQVIEEVARIEEFAEATLKRLECASRPGEEEEEEEEEEEGGRRRHIRTAKLASALHQNHERLMTDPGSSSDGSSVNAFSQKFLVHVTNKGAALKETVAEKKKELFGHISDDSDNEDGCNSDADVEEKSSGEEFTATGKPRCEL